MDDHSIDRYIVVRPQGRSHPFLVAALVVVLVLIVIGVASAQLVRRDGSGKVIRDWLHRAGWVLYTRPGCPYCAKQLELLKGSYPQTVVCSPGDSRCAGITAFPTWVNPNTNQKAVGLQSYAQLLGMTL
jgi:glutaredoxin